MKNQQAEGTSQSGLSCTNVAARDRRIEQQPVQRDYPQSTGSCSHSDSTSPTATLLHGETFSTKEHTSITSRTETSETLDLYSRLDELSLQWSAQKGKLQATSSTSTAELNNSPEDKDAPGFLDDSSLLSFGSFSSHQLPLHATRRGSGPPGKPIVHIPRQFLKRSGRREIRSINSLSSGTSVFDRLYEDAKEKSNARRRKDQIAKNKCSANSVGASTVTSRANGTLDSTTDTVSSSVFERLYRNERSRAKHERTPAKERASELSLSALERRLLYSPPVTSLPKGHRRRQPYASPTISSNRSASTSLSSPVPSRNGWATGNGSLASRSTNPISPLTPASILQRRLQYKPPASASPKKRLRHVPSSPPLLHPPSPSRDDRLASSPLELDVPATLTEHASVPAIDSDHAVVAPVSPPRETATGSESHSVVKYNASATLILCAWRETKAKRTFQTKRLYALRIQRFWRGFFLKQRLETRHCDKSDNDSGWNRDLRLTWATGACHVMDELGQASSGCLDALLIQKHWRLFRARKYYTKVRAEVFLLQRWWRGFYCRQNYLKTRAATCAIQSFWKGCRSSSVRQRTMLDLIARAWRDTEILRANSDDGLTPECDMDRAVAKLHIDTFASCTDSESLASSGSGSSFCFSDSPGSAANTIQVWWRAISNKAPCPSHCQAAINIQLVWRRSNARAKVKYATLIQSTWRMSVLRKKYRELLVALRTLQRFIRGARSLRTAGPKDGDAACLMAWASCIVIQCAWRRTVALKRFSNARGAAILIQSLARRTLAATRANAMHEISTAQKHATVTLQRAWRLKAAHWQFDRARVASTLIQTMVRITLMRRRYCTLRIAVISLQARWRGLATRLWTRKVSYALSIQRFWRSYRRSHYAASIQKAWRWSKARSRFRNRRAAVLVIQSSVRIALQRRRFMAKLVAARRIQSYTRQWISLNCFARRHDSAAVIIQRGWRRTCASARFQSYRTATIIIQSAVRMSLCLTKYRRLYSAVAVMQRLARGINSCLRFERHRAAIVIQTSWRRSVTCWNYTNLRNGVVLLQSLQRKRICRQHCVAFNAAARAIQSLYRRQAVHERLSREKGSSILIQSMWRKSSAHQHYQRTRIAAVIVQSSIRKSLYAARFKMIRFFVVGMQRRTRKKIVQQRARLLRCLAVTTIQRSWRSTAARIRYLYVRSAVILLQSHARRMAVCHYYRQERLARQAACLIQRMWKNYRLIKLRLASSQSIQSFWRRYTIRRDMKMLRSAARLVQTFWRRKWMTKLSLQQRSLACTIIQCTWRRCNAMSLFAMSRSSAIMIQAVMRQVLTRLAYTRTLQFALVKSQHSVNIQRAWRRYASISKYETIRCAVIFIQSMVRMHQDRVKHLSTLNATLAIQSAIRLIQARRQFTVRNTKRRGAALASQNQWRNHCHLFQQKQHISKCAIVIQALWRSATARSHFRRLRTCALLLQRNSRMVQQKVRYSRQRLATLRLQALCRGLLSRRVAFSYRRFHAQQKGGAIKIQEAWALKKLRDGTKRRRAARLLIWDFVWRSKLRRDFVAMRKAAPVLQKFARGAMKRLVYRSMRQVAIRIQSAFRSWKARISFARARLYSLRLQALLRGWLSRRRQKEQAEAAISIQAFARGTCLRKEIARFRFYSRTMNSILAKLMTAIELHRLVHNGKLSRSSSIIPLLLVNQCLRSPATEAFIRLASRIRHFPPILTSWLDGVSHAKAVAAICIQRAYSNRRLRPRLWLTVDSRAIRKPNQVEVIALRPEQGGCGIFIRTCPKRGRCDPSTALSFKRRQGVAVKTISRLDTKRLRVQFDPQSYFIQNEAAKAIQTFVRTSVFAKAKRTRRELLRQVEDSAEQTVQRILAGTWQPSKFGPCVHRLADRAMKSLEKIETGTRRLGDGNNPSRICMTMPMEWESDALPCSPISITSNDQ